MGAITIALVCIVAVVVIGFTVFLVVYSRRREGGLGSLRQLFQSSQERETSTRFAQLDVDEAWDSHVDEEIGYDSVPMKKTKGKAPTNGSLSRDELDERYDELMDPSGQSDNPFGSGSRRT